MHQASQVAVRDDSDLVVVLLYHGGHAEAFAAHFIDGVGHGRRRADPGDWVAGAHEVPNRLQHSSETAPEMEPGEVLGGGAAPLE
ncbi:MAG: hypothetical protein A3J28_03800 [Acidobacteria bacterium RIFCSPLOWO2_12_FULL_60_22]|nr:MAG: hypothetical protein A3J28_03800 [Acidobacteria bacterium RIFCSPLOWO2_12_FULL_60_22]